jgi:serine/threonine-protein kinase SRPK3
MRRYVKGGYHPVHIGVSFSDGRYTIVRKLGWGHFSPPAASTLSCSSITLDIKARMAPTGHVFMVFEVLGENLLGLIKKHQKNGCPDASRQADRETGLAVVGLRA